MNPGALGLGIVFASLLAGCGALYMLQYLYSRREKPGAGWFMGNIAAVAGFCVAYGIALLVFQPTARLALEAITIVCVAFMGPFFLAFGLDYTGRGDLIRTPLFGIVAVVPLLTAVLAATNRLHGLVWTNFRLDPLFGLATAQYTIQPWGTFALLFSIGTAAVGSLLLIGAVLSYGPLYRREALAATLSTLPPSVGVFLWLFGLGPVPQLHLTAPLMVIHIALDAYAFVGTHMFETNPATQRMAERTGLDSLSDPVVVLDPAGRIVRVNDRADALFIDGDVSFPRSLDAVFDTTLPTLREAGEITVPDAGNRAFAVSYTPLTDVTDEPVGSMLVFYDITEERRREQQLAVLNRVLRHNLRNETSVISGYAEILRSSGDDPEAITQAETIMAASNRLLSIAEKARDFESVQDQELQPEPVTLAELLAEVAQSCRETTAEATIEWTVEPDHTVQTDRAVCSLLLTNLVENALVHADDEPRVDITVSESDADAIAVEIRDPNEPIPEMEIASLRTGDESSLQHGQGIGLWIVYWCVSKLQGEIEFAYDDGNVITVTLPELSAD